MSSDLQQQIQQALVLVDKHETLFGLWNLRAIEPYRQGVALNLYGPPGTGKSHCAEAMAAQLRRRFLAVNYSELVSKYVGDTQKHIVHAFRSAEAENAVLFFDEADAMLRRRVAQTSQGADESANLSRSVLLRELDRCSGVVLFATNRAEDYDRAFVRRMLAHVEFNLPDRETRKRLWRHLLVDDLPKEPTVDADDLAERSEGLSGGDMVNVIIRAAARAVQRDAGQRFVLEKDLLAEIARVRVDSSKVGATIEPVAPSELPSDVRRRYDEVVGGAS